MLSHCLSACIAATLGLRLRLEYWNVERRLSRTVFITYHYPIQSQASGEVHSILRSGSSILHMYRLEEVQMARGAPTRPSPISFPSTIWAPRCSTEFGCRNHVTAGNFSISGACKHSRTSVIMTSCVRFGPAMRIAEISYCKRLSHHLYSTRWISPSILAGDRRGFNAFGAQALCCLRTNHFWI